MQTKLGKAHSKKKKNKKPCCEQQGKIKISML